MQSVSRSLHGFTRGLLTYRRTTLDVQPFWSRTNFNGGTGTNPLTRWQSSLNNTSTSTTTRAAASTMLGILAGDLLVNWAGFAYASAYKTEKYFDLTGSMTFVGSTLVSFLLNPQTTVRKMIVSGMVIGWGVRLGSFLFYRISKAGEDRRFEKIRNDNAKFFTLWTGQGVWAFVALLPVLFLNVSRANPAFMWTDVLGWALYATGLTLEVVADYQKLTFRQDPANKGKFINTGLWAYSRHPNYVGEMMIWWGIFASSLAVLRGPQLLSVASPLFVMLILIKGTGLPMLEADANKRWGADPAYQEYKRNTPVLVPLPSWDKPKQ